MVSLFLHLLGRIEYMGAEIEKTIDIDKILEIRWGRRLNSFLLFAVNWLKRILHEDEVNQFLWDSHWFVRERMDLSVFDILT